MKAKVTIDKTFDDGGVFRKEWAFGDFKKFFNDEGEYLDNLCNILNDKGKKGDDFTVTYTVTVKK